MQLPLILFPIKYFLEYVGKQVVQLGTTTGNRIYTLIIRYLPILETYNLSIYEQHIYVCNNQRTVVLNYKSKHLLKLLVLSLMIQHDNGTW